MKLTYFDAAGASDFWYFNWNETYSGRTITGYETARVDGYDIYVVEFFDLTSLSYLYVGYIVDETFFDYQLEGVIVVEKDFFGNLSPLLILEDFSYSSTTLSGLFEIAYVVFSEFDILTLGADTINGNDYSNILDGGPGNDLIFGNGGNDFLDGEEGNNVLYGGSGNDKFYWNTGLNNSTIAYGGTGTDRLYKSSDSKFIRTVDVFGDYFTPGTEYIYGYDSNGSTIRAVSVERIESTSISNYQYEGYWTVVLDSYIPNKNYSSNNANYSIDLSEYMASINYGETTQYTYSLSNNSYSDQFSLSGDTLNISNGSGTTRTVTVTVTGKNIKSNGQIRSDDQGTKDTFTITFKDNDNSSSIYSGTSGNNNRTLTSGNDSWQVGLGIDKINGGAGEDTVIVPDGYMVTSAIDVKGSSTFTGITGKSFLYIRKSDDYTIATNFEKITYGGSTYSISSFVDTGRYDLYTNTIPNKSVSNNNTSNISLSDYFYSINANTSSITYSIQGVSNNNLIDQITLSGSTLKLKAGSQGSSQSVEVTIRATQNFSDGWTFNTDGYTYEDQTFTVSMSDLYDSIGIKKNIFDQDLSYNSFNLRINLNDYFIQPNTGYSIQYSITSSSSDSYASINNSFLTVTTREGVYDTVPITISARNVDTNGNTISGDEPTSQTFYITFAPDVIGTDGDDNITGSSGNDIFNLTDGYDLLDGGAGIDILVIPANPETNSLYKDEFNDLENYFIIKGIDIDGSITGEINKDFLTILKVLDINSPDFIFLDENIFLNDGDKYINFTYAFNFEKIYYENVLYDYDDFISNSYFTLGSTPKLENKFVSLDENWFIEREIKIPDQKISNSSSKVINLENYFINANADLDLKFELVSVKDDISPKNDILSDQITLSGSNLKITSGSSGDLITAKVTITGKLKYDANGITGQNEDYFNYSTIGGPENLNSNGDENTSTSGLKISYTRTFEVTMTDDDYTEDISSSEDNTSYKLSSIKNENGPNLSAFSSTSKTSGTLNHSANNEIIVLTGQAGSIRGLDGDDTYFISDLLPKNSKTSIIDTGGDNIIQIPDNTLITKVIFTSNATRLTLGNDQEITINGADKFIFNVSGNSLEGDKGESLTFSEFAKLFGVELSSKTQTVNEDFYTKSESGSSSSSFNIINVSGNEDTVIFGTNEADEFRFEINDDGTSAEGPYEFTIEGFDKSIDKLTLVNKTGNNILTTQQFDSLENVEVISDGLSGTQIYFAPDNNARSGKLTLEGISETFSDNWTVNSYEVSIAPTSSLSSMSDETTYKFSSTPDSSEPILIEFNSSLSSGTLNLSDQNDLIILTGSGKTARGLSGDDTYFISSLIPENSKITVVDTDGQNTIQIPDNTYISKSLFTKNAARITLENGREVTINTADTFVYNLGGNITTGDKGVDLNFTEFASAFGVDDVLSLTSSSNGTIADQYII